MISEELAGPSERDLLIRIDTKLEGVIADKKDHEERIRKLEDTIRDTEEKVNSAVTPKMLWGGFVGVLGVMVGGTALVDWVASH